jgi:hypothetical protein
MNRMRKRLLIITAWTLTLSGCAHPGVTTQMETCELNPSLQNEKSAELLKIAQEDQADRSGPVDSIDWNKVNPRDILRRVRVAEIFAKGCFKNASDYASAALVFQHGNTADHYYQAFLWANEAVKQGDESQRSLTAAALDRYLVKIGQKQLFGTQFSKGPAELSKGAAGRWCIQLTEPSFPESRRIEYIKLSLKEYIPRVLKGIGSTQSPHETKDCDLPLKASPKGTVPGFW